MTFNAAKVADMLAGSKAERDAVEAILPLLDADMMAEVRALEAERIALKARAGLARQFLKETPDDVVGGVLEVAGVFAATMTDHVDLKSSGTAEGWSGRVLKSIPTPHGYLKVTLTPYK